MREINLKNKKFGRLRVVKKTNKKNKQGRPLWKCLCSCGQVKYLTTNTLRSKNTKSCGCLHKEQLSLRNTTHGKSKTATYRIWQDMKDRCLNPNHHAYHHYGGRGITVTSRWLVFENFLNDMGEKPTGLTLDRADNNKGYSKSNCRWVSVKQQSLNKRNTRLFTHNGKTQCLSHWAKEYKIQQPLLWMRIYKKKMSFQDAIRK